MAAIPAMEAMFAFIKHENDKNILYQLTHIHTCIWWCTMQSSSTADPFGWIRIYPIKRELLFSIRLNWILVNCVNISKTRCRTPTSTKCDRVCCVFNRHERTCTLCHLRLMKLKETRIHKHAYHSPFSNVNTSQWINSIPEQTMSIVNLCAVFYLFSSIFRWKVQIQLTQLMKSNEQFIKLISKDLK